MMKEKQIRSVSSLHCFNYKIFMTDLIIDMMPWYGSYLIFRNYCTTVNARGKHWDTFSSGP